LQDSENIYAISRRRLVLAHVVIGALILGSYYAIVFDQEFWPFSPYPMYSSILDEKTVTGMRLYGVTQEEPHREILLRDPDYVRPFNPHALELAWEGMRLKGGGEENIQAMKEALRDSLRRYEDLRTAGRHHGPRLRGMRLYQEQWQMDARAENLNRPDHRWLIAEVGRHPDE
jgi:hypothetical protein